MDGQIKSKRLCRLVFARERCRIKRFPHPNKRRELYLFTRRSNNDLERVQKRALSIICPHLSYNESLAFLDMNSLFDHHSFLCSSLFSKILDDEEHKLHHLLPPRHTPKYNFRQSRVFDLSYKTNRTKNSFY